MACPIGSRPLSNTFFSIFHRFEVQRYDKSLHPRVFMLNFAKEKEANGYRP